MFRWKYLNSNQHGWILIDGIIATVIVAIALTALAMAYRQSIVVSISAENYSKAVYLAQSTIENLKQDDLTTTVPAIVNDMDTIPPSIYKISIARPTVGETEYLNLSTVTIVPIQVTVSWTESGSTRSVVVTSYYVSPLTAGSLK